MKRSTVCWLVCMIFAVIHMLMGEWNQADVFIVGGLVIAGLEQ